MELGRHSFGIVDIGETANLEGFFQTDPQEHIVKETTSRTEHVQVILRHFGASSDPV